MADDYGFKFNIGDVVKVRGTVAPDGERESIRYLVVERLVNECYGGKQANYKCRPIMANGRAISEYNHFVEVELEASEPFKETEGGHYSRVIKGLENIEAKAG